MNTRIPADRLDRLDPDLVRDHLTDVQTFGGWIESASKDRQQSAYFGDISVHELVCVLLDGESTMGQLLAARAEIRRRFIEEFSADLHYPPEPEVLGWDKRGEFDSATAGVRGRA